MDTKSYLDGEWLKIGINVENGDTIQFTDSGKEVSGRNGKALAIGVEIESTGARKKMQLNKTNLKIIQSAYGFDSDKWVGKTMKVNLVKVNNPQSGQLVDSIALSVL